VGQNFWPLTEMLKILEIFKILKTHNTAEALAQEFID